MTSIIKVDDVQNQPGTNIINKCGTDITLGQSGDTIALASGASQTGFGRTGTVDWITTPKVTGDSPITGVTGKGYFLNTTAGVITVNLPAGAAGSIISLADYAGTWQTNNVTVAANGSEKIGGIAQVAILSTEGQSVTLVYVDSTQGWINTMDSTSNVRGSIPFMIATGGTPCAGTTCGDYKIHKFTGDGTFCVSTVATCSARNVVDYMVVAGAGGGGRDNGGGGGAGGFRFYLNTDNTPAPGAPAVPINNFPSGTAITATASPYSITVGGGGAGAPHPGHAECGSKGDDSIFSTITSTGGGLGTGDGRGASASSGGSGGASGASASCSGPGNNPPVSPPQGNNGGGSPSAGYGGGGGGGAMAVGPNASNPAGGAGGAGAGITAAFGTAGESCSPFYYWGGGGGGGGGQSGGGPGAGGVGGGGRGGGPGTSSPGSDACAGTVNTGGAGGGGGQGGHGKDGGSGYVAIRYKFQ